MLIITRESDTNVRLFVISKWYIHTAMTFTIIQHNFYYRYCFINERNVWFFSLIDIAGYNGSDLF